MIHTERLEIRRVTKEDWQAIRAIWDDQKKSEYACYDNPKDTEPASVQQRIAKWASFAGSTEHIFCSVCLQRSVIGFITLNKRDSGYEAAYCFHSAHHGKGYAGESLRAVLNTVCEEGIADHFSAGTALANTPSVRLLLSLGFRQTGTEQVTFYKNRSGEDIWFTGGIFELDMADQRQGGCGQRERTNVDSLSESADASDPGRPGRKNEKI